MEEYDQLDGVLLFDVHLGGRLQETQVLTDFFTRQAEVLVDGARHSEARQAEVLIGVHLRLEAVLGFGE